MWLLHVEGGNGVDVETSDNEQLTSLMHVTTHISMMHTEAHMYVVGNFFSFFFVFVFVFFKFSLI